MGLYLATFRVANQTVRITTLPSEKLGSYANSSPSKACIHPVRVNFEDIPLIS